ncbi:YD repeat-containing protein [Alteromonadaceae bacterium 2753L.S.0a.02]|nr:YD repeat-containing protein [Alteromonadaceae bacterium 2753L.S.0a.02]
MGVFPLLSEAMNLSRPESNLEGSSHADRFFDFPEAGISVDMFGRFGVFRTEDVVLRSNSGRLPIIVSRVLDIHRDQPSLRVPFSMGNWDLEIPRISAYRGLHRSDGTEFSASSTPEAWSAGYCNNPVYTQKKYSDPKYSLAFWKGLKLSVPGVPTQDLLFSIQTTENGEEIVYPNINDIDATKGNVTYRTTMHWKAECIDLPQGNRSGFLVTAPNGTTYRFDKFAAPKSKINEEKGWWDSLGAYVYATEVKDVFGNTLTYSYESDANGQLYVSSIIGSDGRHVEFEYAEWDFDGHIFWAPVDKTKLLTYVKIMESDGETVARRIHYVYYDRDYDIPFCVGENNTKCVNKDYTKKGLLAHIVLDNGDITTFHYRQPEWLIRTYNEYHYYAQSLSDPQSYTCDKFRNSAQTPWNCGPTYSTLPAPLIQIDTPRGAIYKINQLDTWDSGGNPYGTLSSRAAIANDNESYSWVVGSVDIDPMNGEEPWQYKFNSGLADFYDNPDRYYSEYSVNSPYKAKDLFSWSIEYPENRMDEYFFYTTKSEWDQSKESWELTNDRLLNMVGGMLKRHIVYEKDIEGIYKEKRKTEYWWREHRLVGDNSAYCWIQKCDKPELYTKILQRREIIQDGQTFLTIYNDYDEFGNPRRIDEQGTHSSYRLYEWENNLSKWVLNNQKSETVSGKLIKSMDYYADTGGLKVITENGITHSFTYSPDGSLYKISWLRDGKLHEHKFEDYMLGIPRIETKPDTQVIARDFNVTGELSWREDESGNRTSFDYDSVGNVTGITPPGFYSSTSFNWFGDDPSQVTETRGYYKKIKYYDKLGRLKKVEEKDTSVGGFKRFNYYSYDSMNRQVYISRPTLSESDPQNGYFKTYDALGRVISVIDTELNSSASYCYGEQCNENRDPDAPMVKLGYLLTDFRGYETIFNFKAYGDPNVITLSEVVQQVSIDPVKYVKTEIETNDLLQVESVKRGNVDRSFEYNANNLLWKRTDPETGTVEFKYDEQGNIIQKIFSDGLIEYGYDELNRVRTIDYSDSDSPGVVFEYYPNELLNYVDNGRTRTSYTYDFNRKLESESLFVRSLNKTFTFEYKYDYSSASFKQITYPSGNIYTYSPNAFGLPSEVASTQLTEVFAKNIDYDEYLHIKSMAMGDGHFYSLKRTSQGLPESLSSYTVNGSGVKTFATSYDYILDSSGNVTDIVDNINSLKNKHFSYDGLGQLTYATGGWGEVSYFYDDQSNIDYLVQNGITKDYIYDDNNRLSSVGSRSFSYDDHGNITSDGTKEYIFDFDNRLRYAISQNGTMNNVFDSFNAKVISAINGDSRLTIYDDANQLLYSENLTPFGDSTEYVYLKGKILAEVVCDDEDSDYDGDGIPGCLERRLGFSDSNARDTLVDLDKDKVSVADEYRIGGDPSNYFDSDGDGIPNDWELLWGLNPNLASDSQFDSDGDGVSNKQEFELGINPTVAAGAQDFLYLNTITLTAGTSDHIGAIASDVEGNLYVSITEFLSPSFVVRSRVLKCASNSTKLWEKIYDSINDNFTELQVGPGGVLYAAGRESGLYRLDGNSGNILDSYQMKGNFTVNDLVVTDSSVYLAGSYINTVTFSIAQPLVTRSTIPLANGDHYKDAFVMALDSNLQFKWLRTFGGEYQDSVNAIEVLNNNAIVISGGFWGDVDFNRDGVSQGFHATASKYPNDRFVMSVGDSGEPIWLYTDSQAAGYSDTAEMLAIYREDGSVLVEDTYGYIGRISATGGYLGHFVDVGRYYMDFATGHNGIIASVSGISNAGSNDISVDVVDKFGYSNSFNIGGEGQEYVDKVFLNSLGVLTIGGTYEDTIDFDPGPLEDVHSANGRGIFLTSYINQGIDGLIDSDLDGIKDFADKDDDNDGLPDEWEIENGFNPRDGVTADFDSDNDGLSNLDEYIYKTDPWSSDTDGDGVSDGAEVAAGTDPKVNIPVLITIITSSLLH